MENSKTTEVEQRAAPSLEELTQLFSAKQLRIAHFLNAGMPAAQVSTIVGVSPSYISQLLSSDENFKELLARKSAERKSSLDENPEKIEDEVLTNKYLSLEHNVLRQIESQLGAADIKESARLLEVIGNRQEKRSARKEKMELLKAGFSNGLGLSGFQGKPGAVHVTISMPVAAIPSYTLNSQREVVEINNVPMAPLSSEAVKSLFSARRDFFSTNTVSANAGGGQDALENFCPA